MQPDFRHPLGMPHGAGPGAHHFFRRAPATLNDRQGIDQFAFPIAAAARLGPCQRRQRRDHRPHVIFLDDRIAECGFDAPDPEHEGRLDAEIALNARQQRCVFFRFGFAGFDPPIGRGAVEILPELLVEHRLIADRVQSCHVGLHAAHHPRIGLLADAAGERLAAEGGDPLLEADLGARGGQPRGGCAGETGQQVSSRNLRQRYRRHYDLSHRH
jgi:hypothetical protein